MSLKVKFCKSPLKLTVHILKSILLCLPIIIQWTHDFIQNDEFFQISKINYKNHVDPIVKVFEVKSRIFYWKEKN